MTSFMTSDRLAFRPVALSDAELLASWINDPETRRYLDHRVWPIGIEAEKRWVEGLASDGGAARENVVLLAQEKSTGKAVASTGLHDIEWIGRKAEWGVVVEASARGKGYGQEIAHAMLQYAFSELNLERVYLRVCAEHAAGVACYDKVGFVREGVLRRAFWSRGKHLDMIVMSVLADEWRARNDG